MVIIKDSYETYQNKPTRLQKNLNISMADNSFNKYVSDSLNDLLNFFKMYLFGAALPPDIRHVVAQQNQKSLTITLMHEVAITQLIKGAESKKKFSCQDN